VPPMKTRCCRSTPRCRTCPLRFATELRKAEAYGRPPRHLPAHLADVPLCLHKYEALLRPRDKTSV
jgi:adenine-specific DNA glycosylase